MTRTLTIGYTTSYLYLVRPLQWGCRVFQGRTPLGTFFRTTSGTAWDTEISPMLDNQNTGKCIHKRPFKQHLGLTLSSPLADRYKLAARCVFQCSVRFERNAPKSPAYTTPPTPPPIRSGGTMSVSKKEHKSLRNLECGTFTSLNSKTTCKTEVVRRT